MNTIIDRQQRAKILPVQLNGNSIKKLFKKYEEIGFLYPEKKALLLPHYEKINNNWDKLLKSKEELLWTVTTKDQLLKSDFASITAWKQGNYGLFAQHLVSTGNPLLSLKVMMAAQDKAEFHFNENQVKSCQNWFRPNNRYAYRVFASMYDKLGTEKASLLLFHYLHLSLKAVGSIVSVRYIAEPVAGIDAELIGFVSQQYGKIFMQAEELDKSDIEFRKLNAIFQQYRLSRRRKVIKIRDLQSGAIVACIIANRAPLGINFSFLENRSYYILAKTLSEQARQEVLSVMHQSIQSFYHDFELQVIPIVTDEVNSKALIQQKAVFQRKYMQSIWMREGFSEWYDHIYSFLRRIESRFSN